MTDNATNFEVRERRLKEVRLGEALVGLHTSVYTSEDAAKAFAQLEADAQALADVRTLDSVTTNKSFWRIRPHNPDESDCECVRMVWCEVHHTFQLDECFRGNTPEGARATSKPATPSFWRASARTLLEFLRSPGRRPTDAAVRSCPAKPWSSRTAPTSA